MKPDCVWGARVVIPSKKPGTPDPRLWGKNFYYHVVASTLEEATAKLRKKHPECNILSVNHLGKVLL